MLSLELMSHKSISNPQSLIEVLLGIKTFTFKFTWFNPFT